MPAADIRLGQSTLGNLGPKRPSKKRRILQRYGVNTGDIRLLHRHPLSRRTILSLSDLARRGGGTFAGVLSAFGCRVEPGIDDGWRSFWFLRNDDPILFCVACAEAEAAEEAYAVAERAYYEVLLQSCCVDSPSENSLCIHAPLRPSQAPWLARVTLPAFRCIQARETTVLDELERCLAWTLLSGSLINR